MKSLLLVLCVALAANAIAAVGPTAEQLKTLTKLLEEHHHRYTRQVTIPPIVETTGSTTTPPTDGSETPTTTSPTDGSETPTTTSPTNGSETPTTTSSTNGSETSTTTVPEPSTEASVNFSSPACQKATENIVQSCLVAHGLSFEDLAGDSNNADERSSFSQFVDIFCRDSRCQSDFLQFYEICIGSEEIIFTVRQSIRASCSVSNNGTLCYNVFASSFGASSQNEVVNNISSCFAGVCTQECLEGLTGLSKLGCCVNEYFRVVERTFAAFEVNLTAGLEFEGLWDMCGLRDPGYCMPGTHPSTTPPSTGTPPDPTATTDTGEPSTPTSSFATPPPPPTIPRNSKCARMARALRADQACSGGVNIAELLTNLTAATNAAYVSQLHSMHLCSSQRCFNKYVKTYRSCLFALYKRVQVPPEFARNYLARKEVDRSVYKTFVPLLTKAYCAKKDGEFCVAHHPDLLSPSGSARDKLYPCASSSSECSEDCCAAVRNVTEEYGCCFVSQVLTGTLLGGPRTECLNGQVWKRCGIPNPGKCQVVLRDPRKRPRN